MLTIIQEINNFITYKFFDTCVRVLLDNFYYHIINNMKKLIDQKSKKNINPITFSIFIAIYIHNWPTKFSGNKVLNIKFVADGTIHKKEVFI